MYYPVGDIHGRYDLAAALYEKILIDIEANPDYAFGATIVWLGDYIDRGPQSKQVLDFLMGLENTDEVKHLFLKGNHEEFMTHCARNPADIQTLASWLGHGGKETMESFGITTPQLHKGEIEEYIQWMEQLPVIAHDVDYVFVHAAVDTNTPLDKQNRDRCLWHFEDYKAAYSDYNRVVVHGHQTRTKGPIIDIIPNNRVWMDVGTNFKDRIATVTLPQPFIYDELDGIRVIDVRKAP